MITRKTKILTASAFCALLLLPFAISLADSSASPAPEIATTEAASSALAEVSDDADSSTKSTTEVKTEAIYETAVILQQGDTTLFDHSGNSIGTLRVNPKDGRYAYLLNDAKTEESAMVIFSLSSGTSEEWLRSTTEGNEAPADLLLVLVRYGENYDNLQQGWVNAVQVRNLTVILNNATYNQVHEEIEVLRGEVQRSMQTPLSTPLPSVTPQNGEERMQIEDILENPILIFILLGAIAILLVVVLIVLTSYHKKDERKYTREREKRKDEIKKCLEESALPSIHDSVRSIKETADEQKEDHQVLKTRFDEFSQWVAEKEKPVAKDWDLLIEIAKAEMDQTLFEEWKKAFLSKGWIPQGIRTPELNIPGEYEIADFNMSSDFAAFPVHDPEIKGVLYVIPSLANRDLRSGRTKDLFYIRDGKVDASESYRVIKPALLHSTNDRFYTVQSKGEIWVRNHE